MDLKHIWRAVLISFIAASSCLGQTNSAFTYQGVLKSGDVPANGLYEMQFALYDAPTNGTAIAPTISQSVTVTNGVFTLALDFGPTAFNGPSRWLEVAVRHSGDTNSLTVLSPRQAINPVPYASFAYLIPEGTVTAKELAPGAVSGENIATNSAVRSLNGLRDDVTLVAGSGLSVTPIGNTLQISLASTDGLLDLTTNFVTAVSGSSAADSSAVWAYADTVQYTIVGWGSPIGPFSRIDSLNFWIKPMSNSAVSKVDVQVRKGDASGEVLAHSQLDVPAPSFSSPTKVNWVLPAPITNTTSPLYFQCIADGMINVMTPAHPSYAYPTNQTAGNYWTQGITNSIGLWLPTQTMRL